MKDPDNYVLPKDITLHTWVTFTTGTIDAPRTFNTALSFDRKELFIGTHEITSTVENNGDMSVSSFNFHVSDVMVMPTPTPEPKRMIYGKDWEEIPVKITPTPEPIITDTPEVTVVQTPTVNVTTNITPNVTAVKTTVVPTANQTIPTIPVETGVIMMGIVISILLWREA
jgi:hypothetical protein